MERLRERVCVCAQEKDKEREKEREREGCDRYLTSNKTWPLTNPVLYGSR